MNKSLPEECRRADGFFPDGSERYIWTVRSGQGVLHNHPVEGVCQLGPGGAHEGAAEDIAASMSSQPCDGCGMVHREPDSRRRIVKAWKDDQVVEMSIITFVAFKTALALFDESGVEPTAEQIAEATGRMAGLLIDEGWFTPDEYLGALADNEADHLDEELEQFQHANP